MSTLALNFEEYLVKNSEVSSVTLRNYRADLANFLTWTQTFLARRGVTVMRDSVINDSSLVSQFSPFLIKEYVKSQTLENTPPATINRRLSSLRSFGKFLVGSGYVKDNPFSSFQNIPNPKKLIVMPHLEGEIASNKPTTVEPDLSVIPDLIRDPVYIDSRFRGNDKVKIGIALTAIAAILLIVSLTQTYFLLHKSPPKKTTVLGAFTIKQVRFPLPAPSITFGELLKRE